MVCQNQSIDDSDAPLARDLRVLVRERLQAGDSDRQVIDFLVARYGEFVLLEPRFSSRTALLWLAPGAIVLLGACGLVMLFRRGRGPAGAETALSVSEQARLSEILQKRDRGDLTNV
jgi:cytochrome c-type biogenesis protein CcmH